MAARFLYLTGARFNGLSRMAGAATPSPAASALFGVANLYDGAPSRPFLFDSVAVDPTLTFDRNAILNGNMSGNSGGNLTDWVEEKNGASSDVTYDATGGKSGGPGMKIVTDAAGGSFARGYEDVVSLPGEEWNIIVSLKSQSTKTARFRIQNRWNGKWLTSGGAWQTAQTDVFTETGTSFVDKGPLNFTVESWENLKWPILGYVILRVSIACDDLSAGTGIFGDDCFMWPSTSFFSVHGHDTQPQLAFELRRDTAAFAGAGTLESTMTIYKPTMFWALGAGVARRTDRYWRVKLTGTPTAAPYFGELVLGQYQELIRRPNYGVGVQRMQGQVRQDSFGSSRVRLLEDQERRIWAANWLDRHDTDFLDWDENVMRRSAYGRDSIVIVPRDTDPRCCLYTRVPSSYAELLPSPANHERASIELAEEAFPTFVA